MALWCAVRSVRIKTNDVSIRERAIAATSQHTTIQNVHAVERRP